MELVDGAASRTVDLAAPSVWRDVLALAKPRLSALVLMTSGVGMVVAPGGLGVGRGVAVMLATGVMVAAANALNNIDERHSDARMRRTRRRPLAAGRLVPATVRAWSLAAAAAAAAVLYLAGNPLTALEGFVALAVYAWVYTPMKRCSSWAVLVGALPGALPPLMGWTAAAGRASAGGWALFALLFAWQLPHFLAIAVYLADDYARGGMRVLPLVLGLRATQRICVVAAVGVVAASLALPAAGLGGGSLTATILALGGAFVLACALGWSTPLAWARRVFIASIVYLSCTLAALVFSQVGG